MGAQSSKEQFVAIVDKLTTANVDPSDHEFWDELWKTSLSPEEVFEIISPASVRKMITERPQNMKILFTQAVAQLYQVVETPYPVYFDQALNCTRILSRLCPFLLEKSSLSTAVQNDAKKDDVMFVRELLWSRNRADAAAEATKPASDKESVKTVTESEASENAKLDEVKEPQEEVQEPEPLAVILVNTLFHLLFLPDFTIEDPNTDFSESDINTPEFKAALMWAPGVGSVEKNVASSTPYDQNRIEVLRLMVAAFSDSLFQSPDGFDPCGSLWLEIATSSEIPYAEIVFYSLMNTVLGYDPVGWGLPYGNLVATDTAKQLMETAIQVLIILLDYGYPIKPPANSSDQTQASQGVTYVSADDVEAQGFNIFRKLLSSIEAPDQLNFLFRGFSRLLNNAHQSESSYLPYSVTKIGAEQELLVLFWKCLEEVPKFMPYILRHNDICEILTPICYFLIEGRKDPGKIGLMYLCTFILLKLSGERNFGVSLNKQYQIQLPIDIPLFTGNHADLLVITLHKMIVSGLDKLSALYNCFLTIICNVSPYSKSLCSVSAVKLVNLFQLFTSPKFLYGAEGNHIYVSMILETLNNIVQYQYEGNVNTVYAIIRRKEIFEQLNSLTLPAAIKGAVDNAEKKSVKTTPKPRPKPVPKGGMEESVHEPNVDDATPTDLISTTSIERSVDASGQEKESVSSKPAAHSTGESKGEHVESSKHLRFTPNQAWLDAVKSELPMNTIMRLIKHLVPQVESLAAKNSGILDEVQVMEFIHSTTMVGLLPVPHPIVIRKYQPNKYTCLWFTVFQWGVVFMHNQAVPLFDSKAVKLFLVQTV